MDWSRPDRRSSKSEGGRRNPPSRRPRRRITIRPGDLIRVRRCRCRTPRDFVPRVRQIQCQFQKASSRSHPPPPTPPHRCAGEGRRASKRRRIEKPRQMLLRHERDLLLPSPRARSAWWGGVGGGGWSGRCSASFGKRPRGASPTHQPLPTTARGLSERGDGLGMPASANLQISRHHPRGGGTPY